jgi:uncharacterized protein YsxB (DUF464 family)
MTTASFGIEAGAGALVMDVKGHASFAELGEDPVCAGASVLAMTVAQCVKFMHEDGKLQKEPNIRVKNGRVRVVAKPQPEHFHEALHLFYIGQVGMSLLAETYPENLQLFPFEAASGDEEGNFQESDAESINQKESST